MNWLKALLGFFGIVKNKLEYYKTSFKKFAMGMVPGSIGLTCKRVTGWLSGAINAVTGSPVDHAFMYVGESAGNLIRDKYPELLGKRILIFQNKTYDLGRIPEKAKRHEIVESGLTIEINQLEKYNDESVIMESWARPLTQQDLETVLFNVYLTVGMPYDIKEILSKILPMDNPTMENHPAIIKTENSVYYVSFRVCSSSMARAYAEVERIVLPGIDPEDATPGDLRRYFKSNPKWSKTLFNTKDKN